MKWYSTYEHPDKIFFIIEYDEKYYGAYLYLYYEDITFFEEDIRTKDGCPNHQYDDHQDDLLMAQEVAFDQFGVPLDSWVQAVPSVE